jgi:hypothetical protein
MMIVRRESARCRRSSVVAQARVAALQRFDRPTPSNSQLFLTPLNHLWGLLRLPLLKPQAPKLRILLHPAKGKSSFHPRKRIRGRAYLTTPRRSGSKASPIRKKIGVTALKIRVRIPVAPTFPRFLGVREVGDGREDGRRLMSTVTPQNRSATTAYDK